MDLELASAVFRHLLPDFVHHVIAIRFETSPGRREERFLMTVQRSISPSKSSLLTASRPPIFIEVKYSESMTGTCCTLARTL